MIEDATSYRGPGTGGVIRSAAEFGDAPLPPLSEGVSADYGPADEFDIPPLSLHELTRRFGEMTWLEARLYDVVGYWAKIEANDELAIIFAEIARHHGWHAELWQSALPLTGTGELAEIATEAIAPPHAGWVGFFQALVDIQDPNAGADRVAALALVVDPWMRVRNDQLYAAANPISDRAFSRIQRFITLDHYEDHELLMEMLTRLPGGAMSDIADRLFAFIGENH